MASSRCCHFSTRMLGRPGAYSFLVLALALGAGAELPAPQVDTARDEPILSLTGAGGPEAAESVSATPRRLEEASGGGTCVGNLPGEQVEVEIDEYTLGAKFTCSSNLDTLSPSYSADLAKCHATSSCSDEAKTIASVLNNKGGKLTKAAGNANNMYTISLVDMPTNRKTKMYYKCAGTQQEAANTCTVTVNLPAEPKQNECTVAKKIELKVEKPGDAVFVCPSSVITQPDTRVLTGADCTTEEDLQNVLPGAKLAENSEKKAYTLTVPSLPSRTQTVCYKCDYKKPEAFDSSVSPNCLVRITVSAAATSTTTAATGASAPVSPAVSGVALGAVVAGAVAAH